MKTLVCWLCVLALAGFVALPVSAEDAPAAKPDAAKPAADQVAVVIKTSMGDIELELNPAKAPETVKNFLSYVDEKHYDGTIFHRVIKGFMIQGGGFTKDMQQKNTHAPIKNEGGNGLSNLRGTIAMARTNDPNSATCQFFINVVDNQKLDTKVAEGSVATWGYCVFGQVTKGMEVVDKIKEVATGQRDVPVETVTITAIQRR